jgi:predicted metal-dependent TIM-barrel fold hydrolase
MRIIDPHLRIDKMKGKDAETLSVAGVEGVVLPTPLEPQAVDVCRQVIKVLESERFPMDKVILDHTGRKSLKDRLSSGATTS